MDATTYVIGICLLAIVAFAIKHFDDNDKGGGVMPI